MQRLRRHSPRTGGRPCWALLLLGLLALARPTRAEIEADAETEATAEPEADVETQAAAEPEADVEMEAAAEPEADVEMEVDAEPEADAETEAEAQHNGVGVWVTKDLQVGSGTPECYDTEGAPWSDPEDPENGDCPIARPYGTYTHFSERIGLQYERFLIPRGSLGVRLGYVFDPTRRHPPRPHPGHYELRATRYFGRLTAFHAIVNGGVGYGVLTGRRKVTTFDSSGPGIEIYRTEPFFLAVGGGVGYGRLNVDTQLLGMLVHEEPTAVFTSSIQPTWALRVSCAYAVRF